MARTPIRILLFYDGVRQTQLIRAKWPITSCDLFNSFDFYLRYNNFDSENRRLWEDSEHVRLTFVGGNLLWFQLEWIEDKHGFGCAKEVGELKQQSFACCFCFTFNIWLNLKFWFIFNLKFWCEILLNWKKNLRNWTWKRKESKQQEFLSVFHFKHIYLIKGKLNNSFRMFVTNRTLHSTPHQAFSMRKWQKLQPGLLEGIDRLSINNHQSSDRRMQNWPNDAGNVKYKK